MKDYELLDALGGIDPDYVNAADRPPAGKRQKRSFRWIAAAAALLVLTAGALRFLIPQGTLGRAGSGANEGPVYMSYAGPVFPLSLSEADEDISARRDIYFDFSPYKSCTETGPDGKGGELSYETYRSECLVTDSFRLDNRSGRDKTMTLLYPFAASLNSSSDVRPVVTVNGALTESEWHIGPCSQVTRPDTNDSSKDEPVNLSDPGSWEDYRDLIDGGYQESSFDSFTELDQPVTVYEIKDIYGKESEKAPAPYLNMEFEPDFSRTTFLTFGFNGFTASKETGECSFGTFIPQEGSIHYGQSTYLIVLGKEIDGYRLKTCTDGACETELENAGARAVRYETTLDTILTELSDLYLKEYGPVIYGSDENSLLAELSPEEFKDLVSELIYDRCLLSDSPGDLTSDWMLEDLFSSAQSMTRIMYLTFQVTVPAGGSISVTAEMTKKASMDFTGDRMWRNGYDMVTSLGSALYFTGQSASLSGAEYIEIIRQNFGFDPENGIDHVDLDLNEPRYYIEVQKKDAE
jgi:hypothetical protein